jgi:hypothetical protein
MRTYQDRPEIQIEPRQFAIAAGFPDNWKEEDLQNYIAYKLRSWGYSAETEIVCSGGRTDIVTDWGCNPGQVSVIEVKKYLDRNTIYQASGQGACYKESLPNRFPRSRRVYVMGLLTYQTRDQESAYNTACYVTQNTGAEVIFMNCESDWIPTRSDVAATRIRPDMLSRGIVSLLRWLFLFAGKGFKSARGVRVSKMRRSRRFIPGFMHDIPLAGWLAIAVVIYGIFILPHQGETENSSAVKIHQQSSGW